MIAMGAGFSGLSKNPSLAIFDGTPRQKEVLFSTHYFSDFRKSVFQKETTILSENSKKEVQTYRESEEVNQNCGEVTALHGRALLNGLAKYPSRSKYVLFHIALFNPYFYLGVLGLIRRFFIERKNSNNQICVEGLRNFAPSKFNISSWYIQIRNPKARHTNQFSLSSDVHYKGFLKFLDAQRKKYVVLRFFENLPNRLRPGGDLDILVEDELFEPASTFLSANSGGELVDMYSVSGPANAANMPYYTPFLARKLLDDSEQYNGYSVPSPENYLNSFIYHCLYHKGLSSGIPTKYTNLKSSRRPDNDYLGHIAKLAAEQSVSCGSTLEELDRYMDSVGWRPHIDTLELISSNNKWLAKHLDEMNLAEELTLTICVLKEGFLRHHDLESFKKRLLEFGFAVLLEETLEGARANLARDNLRGGNWSANQDEEYLPAHIFVLFDNTRRGHLVRKHAISFDPRPIKNALRKQFDIAQQSHIHMTDNTHQSMEYVDVLYGEKKNELIRSINTAHNKFNGGLNISDLIFIATYYVRKLPSQLINETKKTLRKLV